MPYIHTQKTRYIDCVRNLSQLIITYQDIINNDTMARCVIGCTTSQLIRDSSFPVPLDSIEDWLKTRRLQQDTSSSQNSSLDTLLDILNTIYNDLMIEQDQESVTILNKHKPFPVFYY